MVLRVSSVPVDDHVRVGGGGGGGVEAVDEVVRGVVLVGAGAAAGVPDGRALQEHLLAVAEGLAALGAPRARRVEVVVVAGLAAAAAEGRLVRFDSKNHICVSPGGLSRK